MVGPQVGADRPGRTWIGAAPPYSCQPIRLRASENPIAMPGVVAGEAATDGDGSALTVAAIVELFVALIEISPAAGSRTGGPVMMPPTMVADGVAVDLVDRGGAATAEGGALLETQGDGDRRRRRGGVDRRALVGVDRMLPFVAVTVGTPLIEAVSEVETSLREMLSATATACELFSDAATASTGAVTKREDAGIVGGEHVDVAVAGVDRRRRPARRERSRSSPRPGC